MPKFHREIVPDKFIIDNDGVIEGAVIKTVLETPEDFIKLYLYSIDNLIDLNPRLLQVLLICVKHSTYSKLNGMEGNFFSNDKAFKENCRKVIKTKKPLSDGAINVCIHRLTELKVIIRYCRGSYALNPRYFFKGKISNKSRLKLVAVYEGNLQK